MGAILIILGVMIGLGSGGGIPKAGSYGSPNYFGIILGIILIFLGLAISL